MKFSFRKVKKKDEKILFEWNNDFQVRRWSFNKKVISLNEHKEYIKKKIKQKNFIMWLFLYNKKPCGLIKISKSKNKAILSYLISKKYRGKKIASIMLFRAKQKFCKKFPNISILAYVLPKNKISTKSLLRAGFTLKGSKKNKKIYIHQCV